MSVFDAGGIVTIVAAIITLVLGTGIFMMLNSVFNITYMGIGAIVSFWFGCCCAAAFIINIGFGLLGGLLGIIWFLVKWAIIIGIIDFIGNFIYGKIKSN